MISDIAATINMNISESERKRITGEASRAMGEYIMSTGKTDFATWSPGEWDKLVGTAFDLIATQVFMKRISVSRPYVTHDDGIPF